MLYPPTAHAQHSLWLDASTSTAQPPAGVTGTNTSAYLLVGLRADLAAGRWQLNGSGNFGSGFENQAGRWLWLDATALRAWDFARSSFTWQTTASSLNYMDPFQYHAHTVEFAPSLSVGRSLRFIMTPTATAGIASSSGSSSNIFVAGATAAVAKNLGRLTTQVSVDVYTANQTAGDGTFAGESLDLFGRFSGWDAGASLKSWKTPLEHEWGYSAYASRDLSKRVAFNIQVARTVTDPVLGTPGSLGASVGLSFRLASLDHKIPAPIATFGERTAGGRKVRFTIDAPAASTADVSGSFTDWNPVHMSRKGKVFSVEVIIPPGTHQYGFVLDGSTWYVPSRAEGVVDDEFGRKNATLVIEDR